MFLCITISLTIFPLILFVHFINSNCQTKLFLVFACQSDLTVQIYSALYFTAFYKQNQTKIYPIRAKRVIKIISSREPNHFIALLYCSNNHQTVNTLSGATGVTTSNIIIIQSPRIFTGSKIGEMDQSQYSQSSCVPCQTIQTSTSTPQIVQARKYEKVEDMNSLKG